MQIVIDIPDEKYERLIYQDIISLRSYVENGIVLPKGHGRLIDADEIQFENNEFDTYSDYSRAFDAIDEAETIIEAESEDKE